MPTTDLITAATARLSCGADLGLVLRDLHDALLDLGADAEAEDAALLALQAEADGLSRAEAVQALQRLS